MSAPFVFQAATRLVAGSGALGQAAQSCIDLGMRRPLLVTDAVIAATAFGQQLRQDLQAAFGSVMVFADCGIDARVAQIDALAAQMRSADIDGVLGLGGGSVICTAKAAALVATNGGQCRLLRGRTRHAQAPLPTVMVPTTAGSGSEVSQFSIVKDDERHDKFSVGGPQCFPALALLDPATLATLPRRPAALAAVDALSHAVEALFTDCGSPVSDALALAAIERLAVSIRPSILEGDAAARLDNLIGASLANMACGNAKLGLCHALSWPLEAEFGLPHGQGMAALLPVVFAFNAPAAPQQAQRVAAALGLGQGGDAADAAPQVVAFLARLYRDLELPPTLPAHCVAPDRVEEMAQRAVTALARGRPVPALPHGPATPIVSPNLRPATVAQGAQLLRQAGGAP